MLFYDIASGRYFVSTFIDMKEIIEDFNRKMMEGETLTYNDFYRRVKIPTVILGDYYPLGYLIDQKNVIFKLYYLEDRKYVMVGFGKRD